MKISRVKIKNYRNLKNIDIELANVVTVIGGNNCGKSNFLRAITLPLSSEDGTGYSKRLTWYDFNDDAKKEYYEYLHDNKEKILAGEITCDEFAAHLPVISIQLSILSEENEHYDIKNILCDENGQWVGGILYRFYTDKAEEILSIVSEMMNTETDDKAIKMSLLPTELYTYSITVPGKNQRIPYDILSAFRSVVLAAERDNFASSADKLGSKALVDALQKELSSEAKVRIEKKYNEFFETVKAEGKLDEILNWQEYSDIEHAKEFFEEISVLPNMPPMSSIIGSVRLGYEDENMFMQGLGYRNLILVTVMLNSFLGGINDYSLRVVTVEEPEAHLCVNNELLMASLFLKFSEKAKRTQIIYSTHSTEFVNKVGLDKVVLLHNGTAINLGEAIDETERDYLAANPNTDIFKLLYSRKAIMVEGITEELLIKSYLQKNPTLNDIKVFSFHKGFRKIIEIWKSINKDTNNRFGIVRDFDNQPKAQKDHEEEITDKVLICTTSEYTLEPEMVKAGNNFTVLKQHYGDVYGWQDMSEDELADHWRESKSDVMLRICHDLVDGNLSGFTLPNHIQSILDFIQGEPDAD